MPKPTIAAVHGPAIAGGTGLATICDFTLAIPAAKFGFTEVRIGFVPALVSAFLALQIGEKRARDLLLTAGSSTPLRHIGWDWSTKSWPRKHSRSALPNWHEHWRRTARNL